MSQPSPPPPPSAGSPPDCAASLRVGAPTADGVSVTVTLHNASAAPLQLLQSTRMPYVIVEAPDQIVLAWSIQPIPPDLDLGGVEPLATVEIAAGSDLQRDATLRMPLQVSTHLSSAHPHPSPLPRTVKVVAEFGLVPEPLDPSQRHRQNYTALVDSQRTCRSAAVTVTLP